MSVQIIEARSCRHLADVARFRYTTYVEELGRPQKHADHIQRTVWEPLDETARITAAYDDRGKIVGTLRTNFGADGGFGIYRDLYQLEKFAKAPTRSVSVTTKLMVAKEYRASSLGIRLGIEAYRNGLKRGVKLDFIDCNPHLEHFFRKLGYLPYCGRRQHEEYGSVLPMRLRVRDRQHLSLVGSPFLRSAMQILDRPPVARDRRLRNLPEILGAA